MDQVPPVCSFSSPTVRWCFKKKKKKSMKERGRRMGKCCRAGNNRQLLLSLKLPPKLSSLFQCSLLSSFLFQLSTMISSRADVHGQVSSIRPSFDRQLLLWKFLCAPVCLFRHLSPSVVGVSRASKRWWKLIRRRKRNKKTALWGIQF